MERLADSERTGPSEGDPGDSAVESCEPASFEPRATSSKQQLHHGEHGVLVLSASVRFVFSVVKDSCCDN
jgi:hypothetical protein